MIYVVFALIGLLIVQFIVVRISQEKDHQANMKQMREIFAEHTENRKQWDLRFDLERQQLLDRIQAPSYDHLKHHEAKIIKLQNPGKEEPKLEVL